MSLTEHDKDYIEKRMHSKDQAQDNMIATLQRGLKEYNVLLEKHTIEDDRNFKAIGSRLDLQEKDHGEFYKKLESIESFMGSLSWLSDSARGISLLKKPALWFTAFIIGLLMLTGGLKSIIAGLISWVLPK